MFENLKDIKMLVIAPHSDDEVYGCAGTIAKIRRHGGEVYVICVSIGDLLQYKKDDNFVKKETRKTEFINTMEFLDVTDYEIIYEDTHMHLRLDTIPRRDLISIIERDAKLAIDKLEPDVVALPAISYNQDHQAVFHAGFTACRPGLPGIKHFPRIVLSYDNPTLFWNIERDKFHPNFYVDISDYMDSKIKALKMHKSQIKPESHHLSVESLIHLTHMRGKEISVSAAEAYMSYRYIL